MREERESVCVKEGEEGERGGQRDGERVSVCVGRRDRENYALSLKRPAPEKERSREVNVRTEMLAQNQRTK